ncbi:MAG: hypothetical protein QXL47_00580 [Candidatus Anstonellales archaeon]
MGNKVIDVWRRTCRFFGELPHSIKIGAVGGTIAAFSMFSPLESRLNAQPVPEDSLRTYTMPVIEVVASKKFVPDTLYEYKYDAVKGPITIPRTFPDVQKTATVLLYIREDVRLLLSDPACVDKEYLQNDLKSLDTTITRLLDFGYIGEDGVYHFKGENDSVRLANALLAQEYLNKDKKQFVQNALSAMPTHPPGIRIVPEGYDVPYIVRIPFPHYVSIKYPESWERLNRVAGFFNVKMPQPTEGKEIDQQLIDVLHAWERIQEIVDPMRPKIDSSITTPQESSNSTLFLCNFYRRLYYPAGIPANIQLVLAIDSVRSIYDAGNVDIECDPEGNKKDNLEAVLKRELGDSAIVKRVVAAYDFLKHSTQQRNRNGEWVNVPNETLAIFYAPEVYSLLTEIIFPYYKKRYPNRFK